LQRRESLDEAEASFFASLQTFLRSEAKPVPEKVSRICAVDAAYSSDRVTAVATEAVDGEIVERSVYSGQFSFPYVAGLLFLHEGPFVTEAVRRLKVRPQLVCFDAHGAAHPRSAGLATICGMVLGIPSIGIAKSVLVGSLEAGEAPVRKIIYKGRVVGFAAGDGGKKYWSPGYSVSLKRLETLIREQGPTCLSLMLESHRLARETMKASATSCDKV
jgi:deoxyribonuclease V